MYYVSGIQYHTTDTYNSFIYFMFIFNAEFRATIQCTHVVRQIHTDWTLRILQDGT